MEGMHSLATGVGTKGKRGRVPQKEALSKMASEKHSTPQEREARVRRTEAEILRAYRESSVPTCWLRTG